MKNLDAQEYKRFIAEVKAKITTSQLAAMTAVNKELLKLYWDIGALIHDRQQRFGWGKSIVEKISKEIRKDFPSIKGFSVQNLWYMRKFYTEYVDNSNLQPLVGEISWSKHITVMSKCKDDIEQEFYIRMTKKYGWSKRVLIHQIENKSYEKYLLNQTNFDSTLPAKYKQQAILAVKDEYTFDFLGLGEKHSEYELEQALIKNIRSFLVEMGSDFSFMGNQYRLAVGSKEYYIDLLLFHRQLQSLIAIELKIGEFEPEHKGKMEFYLTALNEQVKLPHENDAIGIIICKSKDKTVVEYALKSATQPIGVATYAITSQLPKDYERFLPSEEEIRERLMGL